MTTGGEWLSHWISEGGGLAAILDELPERLIVKDRQSVYVACNKAYADDLGLPVEAIVGKTDADLVAPELAARYVAADQQVMSSGEPVVLEEPFAAQGREAWLRTIKKPLFDDKGVVVGVLVAFQDVTEEHAMTEALRRHDWALAALHRAGDALVRSGSEQELIEAVCAALTHDDEYPLCWIGWAEQDVDRTVRVAAAAGKAVGYVDGLVVSWGDGPLGQGPTGRA
ncbi:MAG: PAS domain-containing protein, partial [Zavarzinia sp.]|nr:PAS domain-containing protein [Zavarzinia sp.]